MSLSDFAVQKIVVEVNAPIQNQIHIVMSLAVGNYFIVSLKYLVGDLLTELIKELTIDALIFQKRIFL